MIGKDTALMCLGPLVLVIIAVIMVRKRAPFVRTLASLVLGGCVVLIVTQTIFPLPFQAGTIADERMLDLRNNFVPLQSIRHALQAVEPVRSSALRQLLGNFLLLMPITFLASFIWPRLRGWKQAVLLGLCLSVLIELLQFLISAILRCTYRTTDIDDVLLNALGSVAGYAVFLVGWKAATLVKRRRRHNHTAAASASDRK